MTWLGANVIETASGLHYDFENPDPAQVTVEDIAHGLANVCRFGGHTKHFYSVADHSLFVEEIVARIAPALRLPALFHDGHEYVLGDVPRPMKPLLQPEFDRLTGLADGAIGEALEIDPRLFHHPAVKEADNLALFHEARVLMPSGGPEKDPEPLPDGVIFRRRDPVLSRIAFVERAEELLNERVGS